MRFASLGPFKATQIWALQRKHRTINDGTRGVGRSATRRQTSSSRDHCVLNCAIASSRLAAYPRSVSDGLWLSAVIAQNQGASFGACGWRTIRPMTRSPSRTSKSSSPPPRFLLARIRVNVAVVVMSHELWEVAIFEYTPSQCCPRVQLQKLPLSGKIR